MPVYDERTHPTIVFRNLLDAIRTGDDTDARVAAEYLATLVGQGGILTEEIVAVMDFQLAWEDRK